MDNNTPELNIENENVPDVPEKSKKRERRKLLYYFTNGLILSWLGSLTEAIYRALFSGLFGGIFASYSAEQNAFDKGYIKCRFLGSSKTKKHARNARRVLAEGFENSFSLEFIKKFFRALLETSVKNYGNYMLSFGLYTVFVFFVRRFIGVFEDASTVHFFAGLTFVLVSVPMLMSKKSLAMALGESITARSVLCSAFGMRDESFEILQKQTKVRANLSIILGMVSGMLTFFVPPVYIPLAALLVVAIAMVIVTPEIGVVSALFLLPLLSLADMPSIIMAFIVGLSGVGYFIKLIRGKRILRFEIVDIFVLLFLVLTLFSGMVSVAKGESFYEAVMACVLMSIYFLISNMMRTREWINRCVIALVSSATLTAVIGVFEYFFGELSTAWLDTNYFDDIRGRVVSLFDNSNVLAFYLVMVFPFAINLVIRGRNRSEKFLAFFASVSIALCVVFTWSRGAWLGLIVALLVYVLIKTRKIVKALFGFCLALPVLGVVLPSNVINRFMSIGDLADSSTYYRVLTWRGTLNAISDNLISGYGYGASAFERAYPTYAYAGIEAAEHSHSLYLQILFSVGLIGFVVFLGVILLFSQKNLEFFAKKEFSERKSFAVSAFVSLTAALTMGTFDYIWYNNRILFLFWAVMGISLAVIRTSDDAQKRSFFEDVCDSNSACIDI